MQNQTMDLLVEISNKKLSKNELGLKQQELLDSSNKNSDLENTISELKSTITLQETQISEVNTNYTELEKKNNDFMQKNDNLFKENQTLQNEVSDLQKSVKDTEANQAKLNLQMQNLTNNTAQSVEALIPIPQNNEAIIKVTKLTSNKNEGVLEAANSIPNRNEDAVELTNLAPNKIESVVGLANLTPSKNEGVLELASLTPNKNEGVPELTNLTEKVEDAQKIDEDLEKSDSQQDDLENKMDIEIQENTNDLQQDLQIDDTAKEVENLIDNELTNNQNVENLIDNEPENNHQVENLIDNELLDNQKLENLIDNDLVNNQKVENLIDNELVNNQEKTDNDLNFEKVAEDAEMYVSSQNIDNLVVADSTPVIEELRENRQDVLETPNKKENTIVGSEENDLGEFTAKTNHLDRNFDPSDYDYTYNNPQDLNTNQETPQTDPIIILNPVELIPESYVKKLEETHQNQEIENLVESFIPLENQIVQENNLGNLNNVPETEEVNEEANEEEYEPSQNNNDEDQNNEGEGEEESEIDEGEYEEYDEGEEDGAIIGEMDDSNENQDNYDPDDESLTMSQKNE